jgi:hypothetical protein
MKDRVPQNPGRVLLTPESGGDPFHAIIERADNPAQEGTPLNKLTFLTDETAARFGFNTEAVPNDLLNMLWVSLWANIVNTTAYTLNTTMGELTEVGKSDVSEGQYVKDNAGTIAVGEGEASSSTMFAKTVGRAPLAPPVSVSTYIHHISLTTTTNYYVALQIQSDQATQMTFNDIKAWFLKNEYTSKNRGLSCSASSSTLDAPYPAAIVASANGSVVNSFYVQPGSSSFYGFNVSTATVNDKVEQIQGVTS